MLEEHFSRLQSKKLIESQDDGFILV